MGSFQPENCYICKSLPTGERLHNNKRSVEGAVRSLRVEMCGEFGEEMRLGARGGGGGGGL